MSQELKRNTTVPTHMNEKKDDTKSTPLIHPFPDGPQQVYIHSTQATVHTIELDESQPPLLTWITYAITRSNNEGLYAQLAERRRERAEQRKGSYSHVDTKELYSATEIGGLPTHVYEPRPLEQYNIIAIEEGRGIRTHALITIQDPKTLKGRKIPDERTWKEGITHHYMNGVYNASMTYTQQDYQKAQEQHGQKVIPIMGEEIERTMCMMNVQTAIQLISTITEHGPTSERFSTRPTNIFRIQHYTLEETVEHLLTQSAERTALPPKIYEWILGKKE